MTSASLLSRILHQRKWCNSHAFFYKSFGGFILFYNRGNRVDQNV